MHIRVGDLPVEITRAEAAKFRHPLLLVHGLWTGSWIWLPMAAYLGHRGWESWAPSMAEAAAPPSDIEVLVSRVESVARALPASPIIVAHDTGVIAAAVLASRMPAPALIALAPVVAPADAEGRRGIFAWPRFWPLRVRGALVSPPRRSGARALLGAVERAYRDRLVPDSAALFRALATDQVRLPARVGCPGLVMSGDRDAIAPPEVGKRIAARFSWESRIYPGRGHFVMLEPGWEELTGDLHRWIVQTIGADLLALLEDEEEEP
jgi:pimeloyl-ACP methyl ester carboxylesterase